MQNLYFTLMIIKRFSKDAENMPFASHDWPVRNFVKATLLSNFSTKHKNNFHVTIISYLVSDGFCCLISHIKQQLYWTKYFQGTLSTLVL